MAYIESVRLRGFKAVGSDWLEVSFGSGLNAIVGPNGCGKSSLLEALCFAFAAPLRSFGVAALADLANTDSVQVCEVHVQLLGGRSTRHLVQAALLPDGSRAYKVDGRARTGKEVREYLQALGISLGSAAAVIRQARVTALADSASPADLAAIVADASGLGRWNAEVTAAAEELARSRKALADVHSRIAAMEESAAANLAKLAALEHINQLDHEAASLAEELATTILAALCACDREAAKLQVKATAAASAAADARSVADAKQRQVEQAQTHLAAVRLEHACRQIGRQELLKLQQNVAAAEESMQLLHQQQASRSKLAAQLESVNGKLLLLTARHTEALAKLEHCRKRHLGITSSHGLSASASASTAELQALLNHEVQLLQAAVKEKQLAMSQNVLALDEQSSHMEQLLDEQRRLESDLAHLADSPPCPAQAGDEQLVAGLQQRLAVLQQEERMLGHRAGTLAARLGSSGSHQGWRFLHECFSFKEPQQCQQYATALQLLTEGKLSIVVADATSVAGQLLAAGSTARIWPLDVLEARSFTAQQQAAAANFSNGEVIVPMDLLDYDSSFTPALLRAFGSFVLAANDEVSEQLMTRFGLPSVTIDGKMTKRGTLQGGWRGPSVDPLHSQMGVKISLSAAYRQLAGLQRQVSDVGAELKSAEMQHRDMQRQMIAMQASAAKKSTVERQLAESKLRLGRLTAIQAGLQEHILHLKAELASKQEMLAVTTNTAADSNTAVDGNALSREQRSLEVAIADAQAHVTTTEAELAAAAAEAQALDDELAVCATISAEDISSSHNQLAEASRSLQQAEAILCAQSSAVAVAEEEVQRLCNVCAAAEQAVNHAAGICSGLQQAACELEAERIQLERSLSVLLEEIPELKAAAASERHAHSDLAELHLAMNHIHSRRLAVWQQRSRMKASELALNEQLEIQEHARQLAASKLQASTLLTATEQLQKGMAGAHGHVLAVNESVFDGVAASFSSLVAAVLPSFQVRLRKSGSHVHEGILMEVIRSGISDWQAGLDSLSGGQRTMVSLAFVVAAATAGSATSVFLMDEVDAALDETNQALVARLFDALCKCTSSRQQACRQVLCVSHNASFQHLCQHAVHLTRDATGTQLAQVDKACIAAGQKKFCVARD